MNKLELKEIVGYLPYGLKMVSSANYVHELLGIDKLMDLTLLVNGEERWNGENHIDYNVYYNDKIEFKPILQPLSNFESENIDDIKEYLGIGQWCDHYDYYFHAWFDDAESVNKLVLQAPYEVMEFFFLNHYDVFGLIEKGLAIAVTEDFNPYSK
jgi:hypothetical protein